MHSFFTRFLISVLLMASAVNGAFAGDRQYLQNYSDNLATATSITILTGITGTVFRVHGLEISTDTEGLYTLRCGSSAIKGKWALSKNGGLLVEYININKACAASDGLFLDKPSNANTFTYVWYDKR